MRGNSGVANEGRVVGYQSFIPGVIAPCHNEYQLRLDVQRFLWPMYYIVMLFMRVL